MARPDRIPIDAPKLATATAVRTLARVGRFVRPYLRQVAYAAIALLVAAGAVLAIGQGLRVRDRPRLRGRERCGAGSSPHAARRRDHPHGRRHLHTLLLRLVARRARHRRPATRSVRSLASPATGILRGHANRRSHLAAHQRYDDARNRHRLELVDGGTQPPAARRRSRDACVDQRQAHAARSRRRAVRGDADHPVRPARAASLAGEPGSRRRCQRVRRRGVA